MRFSGRQTRALFDLLPIKDNILRSAVGRSARVIYVGDGIRCAPVNYQRW